jgi:siroheme synthase
MIRINKDVDIFFGIVLGVTSLMAIENVYGLPMTCGGELYQSVAYQINTAHTGVTSFSKQLVFPLQQMWQVDLEWVGDK